MRISNLLLLILLPSLAVVAVGCGGATGEVNDQKAVRVATSTPARADVRQFTKMVGHVEAWEDVVLYSKVAGYLEWVGVDRGSWVKAGEVVARVDDPEMGRELERMKAEADAKLSVYNRLDATGKQNPDMVRQMDLDRAKGESDAALAAQKRLEQLVAYSEIRAPFSGVITQRWVDPGALIQVATSSQAPTARIVRLMRIDSLRVAVEVPERDSHRIREGQTAVVRIPDISEEPFEGHVARFSWAIDPSTRTMTAEVDIQNKDYRILPGMYATVEIIIEQRANAMLVPNSAIEVTKGQSYVWIVSDGKAKRVPVTVGYDDGINSEIIEGLTGSEQIVVQGRDRLHDGVEVSTVETSRTK